mmetsp:Transcript_13642/g.29058  ORF Transcript_13642/g.29058 Transcript_13642/m.29058 type:complete len:256 (-) Transcript_13642:325-1092(-)
MASGAVDSAVAADTLTCATSGDASGVSCTVSVAAVLPARPAESCRVYVVPDIMFGGVGGMVRSFECILMEKVSNVADPAAKVQLYSMVAPVSCSSWRIRSLRARRGSCASSLRAAEESAPEHTDETSTSTRTRVPCAMAKTRASLPSRVRTGMGSSSLVTVKSRLVLALAEPKVDCASRLNWYVPAARSDPRFTTSPPAASVPWTVARESALGASVTPHVRVMLARPVGSTLPAASSTTAKPAAEAPHPRPTLLG